MEGRQQTTRISANVAGVELERIAPSTGIDQQRRFSTSRDQRTPRCTRRFQWDDSKAAEAYRLHQASTLSRSIVVIREDGGIEHRAYSLVTKTTT